MRRRSEPRFGKLSDLAAALEELLARRESRVRVKEKLAALVWPEAVGDFYASRTKVTRVERGIMYVWCNSPALAHQLSLDAQEIIRRINSQLAGQYVREIRPATTYRGRTRQLRDLNIRRTHGPTREDLARITLSTEEVEMIEEEAELIEDEALRERFRKAAISERRARKWREAHGYRECPQCGWRVPPALSECSMCGWPV